MNHPLALAALMGLLGTGLAGDHHGTRMTSFIPKSRVGEFLAEKLDLSTFRNSFGPRRNRGQRHFADFNIKPTRISPQAVEFDLQDWFYCISVVKRGDVNGDGLEDLVIRFTDKSKQGTYAQREQLLVTRYSEASSLIALAFTP